MAEKKAPSGRKNAAPSGGKSGKAEGKTKAQKSPGAEKPASGATGSAKTPDVKTATDASPGAVPAPGKSTAADAAGGPAKAGSGADAATGATPASEKPEKDTPAASARTTIPASGTKAAAASGTGQTTGTSASAMADRNPSGKAGANKPDEKPAGTKATTSGSETDDKSPAGTDVKSQTATLAGDKPTTGTMASPAAAASTQAESPKTSRQHAAPSGAAQPPARKGGFFALLLGGVCAAAIGFGAAYYILPELGMMSADSTASDDAAAKLAEQSDRITALEARIDAIPGAPDTSGIEAGQTSMAAQITELSDQVGALTTRLSDIEQQPVGPAEDGVTSGQLTELRRTLKAQGDQLARLVSEAERRDDAARASAQQDLRRAALTRIRTALDTGTPFAPALGDLERAGMAAPDALQDVAEAGVPTQNALQQSFAPAARAALAEARRSGDEEGSAGVWSFMSEQLGVRSLERREGPGTDAVLSRAEDDLRQGNLQAALTEVETLPDSARAELSDWADSARARMQAIAALDALAAKLN